MQARSCPAGPALQALPDAAAGPRGSGLGHEGRPAACPGSSVLTETDATTPLSPAASRRLSREGPSVSRDAPPPPGPGHVGGAATASVTVRQSQSWLRESGCRRCRRQRTGRGSRCQVLIVPPLSPQSVVPGWARPSWSGAGPLPGRCEVRRHRRLRFSRPPNPRRRPEPLALGSLSPPPGGLARASGEGAGPAPPLPQLGNGSGLAEPGLEVRRAG